MVPVAYACKSHCIIIVCIEGEHAPAVSCTGRPATDVPVCVRQRLARGGVEDNTMEEYRVMLLGGNALQYKSEENG